MKKLIAICITIILVVAIVAVAVVIVNVLNNDDEDTAITIEYRKNIYNTFTEKKVIINSANKDVADDEKAEDKAEETVADGAKVENKTEETETDDTEKVADSCFEHKIKVDYVIAKLGTCFDYCGRDCTNHSNFTYENEPSNYSHDLYITESGCIFEANSTHNHNAQIIEFGVNGNVYHSVAEYLENN